MAIVKMNKFTLLTFESYKTELLKELQKIEVVHFKNLQQDESEEYLSLQKVYAGEEISDAQTQLAKCKFAISKITPYADKPSGLSALTTPSPELGFEEFERFTEHYDYNQVYTVIKDQDEKLKLLKAEKNKLKSDCEGLKQWLLLDVSTRELDALKSVKYLTGVMPKAGADTLREMMNRDFPATHIEYLDQVKEDVGLFIITIAEQFDDVSNLAKNMGFTKVSLNLAKAPRDIVKANEKRISEIEREEEGCLNVIKGQSGHYKDLQIVHDYFKTITERYKANENFLKTRDVYILQGWVSEDDVSLFNLSVNKVCGDNFYLEMEAEEKDSTEVPIKLKNNKLVSAFENITAMYSYPKYNEIDPTPLLTPFYLLFFGIMVGDAGYGLIFVIATALVLKFCNVKPGMRKFMQFFHYLGYATIFAGIIFGSAFGFPFFTPLVGADGNPKAILDSQQDIVMMLVLSIAIGVIQIIFGLGIKGYVLIRDGKIWDAIFDALFWMTAVISLVGLIACAAFSGMAVDPQTAAIISTLINVFKWMLVISLVGLAATQGRQSPSLGGKIGNGLYSVYNITGYVGDFVSYTRLVALALSGAYIAYSFNLMGGLMPGVLKYIAGTIIVVLGGLLNIGLSGLGAYVHTCRLQYVEFFGKFYEGGGKPFKPFELKNTFVNIKK